MRNVICTTCKRTYGKKMLDFGPNVCHRCSDREKAMKSRLGSYYARPTFRPKSSVDINVKPRRTYYPPPEDPLEPILLPLIQEQMTRNIESTPKPSFVGGGGSFGGAGASESWDSSPEPSVDVSFDTPDSSNTGS